MSADLHIHILDGITEDDLARFFSNTIGSKYFGRYRENADEFSGLYDKLSHTPSVWIGSVSWLKQALTGDDSYVPSTVEKISDLVGEDLPVLDDTLASEIMDAFKLENETSYDLAKPDEVKRFLEMHKGKRVFTVSW